MKINDRQPIQPADLGKTAALGATRPRTDASAAATDVPAGTGQPGAPAARVELSSRSRELHDALRAANAAPDVREAVVSEVRAKLNDGTYRVDPETIARRMLDTKA